LYVKLVKSVEHIYKRKKSNIVNMIEESIKKISYWRGEENNDIEQLQNNEEHQHLL